MPSCFMKCDPPEGGGSETYYVAAFSELTIYGHTVDAWTKQNYPEDWQLTVDGRKGGYEFGCWHSAACPDGELGSNHASVLARISYEQFIDAREKGWPDDYPLTTSQPVVAISEWNADGSIGPPIWDSLHGEHEKKP